MATYLWSTIMRLPFLGRLKLKFVILIAVDVDDDNGAQELCRVSVNLWITI